jgi:hypothetical protein
MATPKGCHRQEARGTLTSDAGNFPSTLNSSDARKLVWSLGLAAALLYLAFLPPGIYSEDGNSMLSVAEAIITRHSLTVPAGLGIHGRGGEIYSVYYPLQSLLAVPFVGAAAWAARLLHAPFHFIAAAFAGVLPAVYTAATVAMVAWMALQLGSTLQGARRAALSFGFGTVAMVYTRTFYAEPLLSLLVTAAVCLTLTGVSRKIIFASLLAFLAFLAVLAKPTGILLGPPLSLYLFLKKTPARLSILPAAGSGFGLLSYILYNLVRFGNPLNFGPSWAFSLSAFSHGIAGLLCSPGRGILWYCPPVVMAVLGFRKAKKTMPIEALLMATLFAGFLALHSLVPYWHGGWSWGPRYLLPVLPGLMALTGLLEGKAAKVLLALAFAGFLVNAPAMVSFYERYYAEANEQGVSDSALLWSPSRAPLLHAWGAASREIADARNHDVREMFHEAGTPSATIASSRALRVVALWWWVLPVVRIPRWIGIVCSLAMVIWGCWILLRMRLGSA